MSRSATGVVFVLALTAGLAAAQDPTEKLELRVLYAGVPDSPRTKDFTDFLGRVFTRAATVDLSTLDSWFASHYDVVIIDAPSPYRSQAESKGAGTGFEMPKVPVLTPAFGKPTILIGAAGGYVLSHLDIKLNWL